MEDHQKKYLSANFSLNPTEIKASKEKNFSKFLTEIWHASPTLKLGVRK